MNKGRAPILIIFPPHSGHLFYPCLSLPSLTAYLRANDHEVVQLDWGLETFDRMLSREFLSDIRRRNETAIRSLSGKKRKSTADSRRLRALERANTGAEPVIDAIDAVKDILRDGKRFYEPRSYSFASGVITEALKIVSAGFHPTSILENRLVTSGGLTLDTISHLSIDP